MSKAVSLSALEERFPSKKEYYSVRYELMPKIGTPVSFPAKTDLDTIFEVLMYDRPGTDGIEFGLPEFYKSAKAWDCIGWLSSPDMRGLFLSEKAASVFSKFNLGKHRFYPFKALHQGKELAYCYLHIQSDETNCIDCSGSTFYYEEKDSDIFDKQVHSITFRSIEELHVANDELGNRGTYSVNAVFAVDIKLNEQFDKTLDIFTFADVQRNTIISANLKLAVVQQKLTGFNFKDVNVRT